MTFYIVGSDALVTSFIATIATGWSDPCRVGLSPLRDHAFTRRTGKKRLSSVEVARPHRRADQVDN